MPESGARSVGLTLTLTNQSQHVTNAGSSVNPKPNPYKPKRARYQMLVQALSLSLTPTNQSEHVNKCWFKIQADKDRQPFSVWFTTRIRHIINGLGHSASENEPTVDVTWPKQCYLAKTVLSG